ncbi:unnamed protein product, partial [Rotaria sordida]
MDLQLDNMFIDLSFSINENIKYLTDLRQQITNAPVHITVTSSWLLVLIAIDRLIRARFPYRQAQ